MLRTPDRFLVDIKNKKFVLDVLPNELSAHRKKVAQTTKTLVIGAPLRNNC